MRIRLTSAFYLLYLLSFGQGKIDSVENSILLLANDSVKVDKLIGAGYQFYNSDPDKTLFFGQLAASISDSIGYAKGIIRGKKVQGISYWVVGDYKKALEAYEEGMAYAQAIKDSLEISTFHINLGVVYTDIGDYEKSLQAYLDGLKIVELTDRKLHEAICYQNIGEIYKTLNEPLNALSYNLKALDIFEELNDQNGVAVILNNNGEILLSQDKNDSALQNLRKSRSIFEALSNIRGVSITTSNIGRALTFLGNYQLAEVEFNRSISLKKEIDDKNGLATTYKYLGVLKKKIKDYDQAQTYFMRSLEISTGIGAKEVEKDTYNEFSLLYQDMFLYAKSLEYYKKYSSLKDSLINIDKNKQVVLLQTLYDSEKKDKENLILRKNQELDAQTIAQQQTKSELYFVLLVVSGIAIIFLVYAFQQKIKSNRKLRVLNQSIKDQKEEIETQSERLSVANKQIKELNSNLETKVQERTKQLLEYSFKNSHEVRAPLARILGLIDLYKSDKSQIDVDDIVVKLEQSAIELDDIVREVNNILNNPQKDSSSTN